ncbi:hypothetical protein BJ912DRAFT_967209 [Pholiota molesta]|nr:hypothetical protein BJ912DRAFT_967209 [Pholiota molesta]
MDNLSDFSESEDDTAFISFNQKLEQAGIGLTTPRARCSSLPPSSGPCMSSPIIAKDPKERKAHRIRKGRKAREITLAMKQQEQKVERERKLDKILEQMDEGGLLLWDLMEYAFNPDNKQGTLRWHGFFVNRGNATQVLDWWTSSKNAAEARYEVTQWARNHISGIIAREAAFTTKSKELQTRGQVIDEDFVTSFNFVKLHDWLSTEEVAPVSMQMFRAFATSRRVNEHSERRKEKTQIVVTSAALACLGEYSHSNNRAKRVIGLYMYACGAQRQLMAVMSTLGLSESYSNLTSKNYRRTKDLKEEGTGNQRMEHSMRKDARDIAASGLFATVYDNINMNMNNAEQILGRHDSQENGTCATLVPLFDAKVEEIDLKKFQTAFLEAPTLKREDILHTPDEGQAFSTNLVFTILRVIIKYGGEGFGRFEKDLEKRQPNSPHKIEVHRSELHPLPAWNIDESTITGNAEVCDAIYNELDLGKSSGDRVRFMSGDQLSIARLRALENIRAGHEDSEQGFFWGVWIPGLFHAKIADVHGILLGHFGKPDTGQRNPGSLWFHNAHINRLPITISSPPTFRTCRDLVFVSLYARVLHCLLLVSGHASLEDYLAKVSGWEELYHHAEQIYSEYASPFKVEELRWQRERCKAVKPTEGDMVFENALLFMRDALISREFTDAVKAGDSGRVVLVLKIWALSFRGNGRTKYAYEMLHFIHNITNAWPEAIRDIVLKNWLLNTTGNPNSFCEFDLTQEHLNFWIKNAYKAHGTNASWEWLEIIAPICDALRKLARNFNDMLGTAQGVQHSPPDLTEDIASLMTSLDANDVYRVKKGRVLVDEGDEPVKDFVAAGLQSLEDGPKSPLVEYNAAFRRLQKRRNMSAVSSASLPATSSATVPTAYSDTLDSAGQPDLETAIAEATETSPDENSEVLIDVEVLTDFPADLSIGFDSNDDQGDEPTEVDRILDDLEHGVVEPTLQRLSERDVELDMDEFMIENSDSDSDGSETEGED